MNFSRAVGWQGGGMRSNFQCKIGNGLSIKFWEDCWLGEESLKVKFRRLFRASAQKNSVIGEIGEWVGGEWKWKFEWIRNLRAGEGELFHGLLDCLDRYCCVKDTNDEWA